MCRPWTKLYTELLALRPRPYVITLRPCILSRRQNVENKNSQFFGVKIKLMMRWTYCMMLHLNTKCPLQNFNLFMYPARAVDSGAVQRVSFLHLGGHFKKKSNFSVTPNAIVTWMGGQKCRDNNYVFENICICVDKAWGKNREPVYSKLIPSIKI